MATAMKDSPARVLTDLPTAPLVELALARGEGVFADSGALVVETGQRTGRSPRDKFIVHDALTSETVDWGEINQPVEPEIMDALWQRVESYMDERETLVNHLHVGSDDRHYLPVQVRTQYAWHALFARNLFICPHGFNPLQKPVWTVISAPDFMCDPARDGTNSDAALMIDFTHRKVLLAGLKYAGEMKKSMFSVLNFILPESEVLPMHCSANMSSFGEVTLFFGLSGTGKTTLSSDPDRVLIGDDEHGWGKGVVFNFEGGCYAKCINLSSKTEPVIFDAIRFGAITENLIIDEDSRAPDYTDDSKTENTRACYPLSHVTQVAAGARGGEPNHVIFLTCDVSGVLPPVSILSRPAAAYHFLSGYTAKVGSTEVGSTSAYTATFSAGFGRAFLPRRPGEYARLLMKRVAEFDSQVFLVNTGWTGGGYGVGHRFLIPDTRAMVQAIQSDSLRGVPTKHIDGLNLDIPVTIPSLRHRNTDPRASWANKDAYDLAAKGLIAEFRKNCETMPGLDQDIVMAGPGNG